jgi:toxin FitB
MAYLLDTNVVSELRKRQRCNRGVRRWYESIDDDDLMLSVLVIGEIRHGIERLRSRDPSGARALDHWLHTLESQYEDRILPINLEICRVWGRLSPQQPLAPIDGLMAATALHHELVLVTRNVDDVQRSGVEVINPFDM